MRQYVRVPKVPALNQGEGALSTQRAGGVLLSAPYRLHLNMAQAADENGRVVVIQFGERLNDRVLGPALGVGFDGVREETVDRGHEIGNQILQPEVTHNTCGLGNDVVVPVRERFPESGGPGRGVWSVSQILERREPAVEVILGHSHAEAFENFVYLVGRRRDLDKRLDYSAAVEKSLERDFRDGILFAGNQIAAIGVTPGPRSCLGHQH